MSTNSESGGNGHSERKSAIRLEKRPDGVAIAWLDTPDSRLNIISTALAADFAATLQEIESDAAIKAVVIASAKPDNFMAGADVHEFLTTTSAEAFEKMVRAFHEALDRIAGSRKPYVAAIHGPCLGGGYEMALACHYRVASDDPKTVVGLPEVMMGVFPAGGGCQRLPRLIGVAKALPMILAGQRIKGRKAKKLGMVDLLTTPKGIADTAAKAALQLAEGKLRPERELGFMDKLFGGPLLGMVMGQARKETMKKTRGNYPAPLAVLECVETGLRGGFKAGQEAEIRNFGRVAAGPEAKNLIRLFDAMNELKKSPVTAESHKVDHLAIIGGGFMGEGIAAVSIGMTPTVVKDIADEALAKCAKNIWKALDKRLKSGSLTRLDRDRNWANLHFTKDYAGLANADLVIEAVFEKLDLKQRVLADTEAAIAPDAVFATNTSALPIGDIAAKALHPERVVGMHYFSPVPKMPLLEIVRGPKTDDQAVATAHKYGSKQGKTCIVVNDGPGFYTSRVLGPLMNEAMLLLEEGADIGALDKAWLDRGWPVGPVALMDEVGIDVAGHVAQDLGKAFAGRMQGQTTVIAKLVDAGYAGRKNNRGFYAYPPEGSKKKKTINADVYQFFGGPNRKPMNTRDMVDRLEVLFINEAVYCLQEGILATPRDGDVGAILGLGFPPFRGGPFRYVDAVGADKLVARMEELAAKHGSRFTPAPLLKEMATAGKVFYPPDLYKAPGSSQAQPKVEAGTAG
ncbi:MAG: enoyl-CoA hydratase/isomerase family protein [Candidatus Sericytochromatia bacterium]|nr:enoyl-CoA hydratase/isomerase family protein [Candidatus Tanganyikabacteria bacterium]